MNSEFRYGVPLQTQPLLDYLGQMSAEADEKHHSLSRSGAADLVASVDVDVNDENLLIGLNPFAKPVGKSEPKWDALFNGMSGWLWKRDFEKLDGAADWRGLESKGNEYLLATVPFAFMEGKLFVFAEAVGREPDFTFPKLTLVPFLASPT